MKDENRIPFDIRQFNLKNNGSFEIDDFHFTEKENAYVPNFVDMGEALIHVDVLNAVSVLTLTLSVSGPCVLKDSHTGENINYELDDSVDVLISKDKEEESDIEPDSDGIYDLRGSVLALLFDAIPKNYSEVPLTSYGKDNYVVMSEEEYRRTHKEKTNSAFSDLDEEDFQ